MAPHLHLSTLGAPLLLTEAGEQIRFRTRKQFALLIRLATEAGKKLTRDYLMDLLWPDSPSHLARHSLAQALTVVKEKVGREYLQVQRATIALADEAVDADLRRLDASDVQIRGPFLEGFDVPGAVPFEQWKDEWRAKLMPRIRDCLVRQMDAGRRIGDFAAVERHAQVLLELDPLSEDAVRGVMEARAWVGDRSNALKVYGRFEARLAEDLGARPSADLARIAELLREGRRPAPRPAAPGEVPERQERRFEAETLIGREREFARLYDAWLEVRGRVPRIMVLLGDPGVGKTTLANAFVSTCQMDGAVVARAQAYDAERELPFAVLAELVKQLTLQRAIGATDPEALSELTRVSPEIFSVFPGVPKPVDWAAEVIPLRIAASFLKAVEAAADESPLTLVVDDIHAADNASVAILHMVARKLPHTRLLLILTARSNELRTVAGPRALVSDSAIQALQTVELEPLSADAAERLVAALAAKAEGGLAEVPATRILEAGKGNPLALELLTKEWLAHGSSSLLSDLEALNTQPVANLGIPRAIGAVFERQIRRLDRRTRAALDLAAVLGRRLADLPLYEVVDLTPAGAGEALSRLKEEGILREVHGALEFRNELIRAQAYYAVAGPVRQHLHRRVGEGLAERPTEERQSISLEIAWHWLRGSGAASAWPFAIDGAEAAVRTGAPYEAEQILTALLRSRNNGLPLRRIRLLLTRAYLDQSKADDAAPILEELLGDPELSALDFAQACRMQAGVEYLLNRQAGRRYTEATARALEAARQTGDVEPIARALFEYARSGVEVGDERRVMEAQSEIEKLVADPVGGTVPMVFYAHGYCRRFFCDMRQAISSLHQALHLLAETSQSAVELSLVYNTLGSCEYMVCDFGDARQHLLAALDLARRMGDDSRFSLTASNLGVVSSLRGDLSDAIHFCRIAVETGTRAVRQPLLTYAYMNLAEVYLLSGQAERAEACMQAARLWSSDERSWRVESAFLCESANLALMQGNLRLALENVESLERLASGRERAVPEQGMFQKLRIFRAAHTHGADSAFRMAQDVRAYFPDHRTVPYLQVLAAIAWTEQRTFGYYTETTKAQLQLFEQLGASGLRTSLKTQGFLD